MYEMPLSFGFGVLCLGFWGWGIIFCIGDWGDWHFVIGVFSRDRLRTNYNIDNLCLGKGLFVGQSNVPYPV